MRIILKTLSETSFEMLHVDSPNVVRRSLENLSDRQTHSTATPHENNGLLINAHAPPPIQQQKHRKYGWTSLRPDCIQCFNRPVFFLICLCILVFGQGLACTGINNTMLTSIEKRYGFSTTQLGLFSTLFHISVGIFVSLVCYFGHRHRPLTLALGSISICVGLFIITIPHYMSPGYEAGVAMVTDTCRISGNATLQCQNTVPEKSKYFTVFIIGYCFVGLGVTPIYSLGYAHLDDIVGRGKNSMYFSIMGAASSFGPAVGFLMANPMLNIFVDLEQPPNSSLTPKHRNWVGAWWIGYLVGVAVLLIPVIPLLGFPPVFPNAEQLRKEKNEKEDTLKEDADLKHGLKSLWPSTKALVKNMPFVCICLASATECFAIGGLSIFTPKFAETQFNLTAANSALYTGLIVIFGVAGGMFLGGYLCKRFQWNCQQTLSRAAIMAFIAVLFSVFILIGCDGRNVVGGDVKYPNTTSIGLDNLCNAGCQCSTRYYKPVCSISDQLTYYSPCHAGCSSNNTYLVDGIKTFTNCSCLPIGSTIQDGRCSPLSCTYFPLFVVCALMFMLFTFMNNVPLLNALFRVVPEGQGSFAMGLQQMTSRFIGFIPAPMLYGRLIDASCKMWHRDECTGETTSCLEYKNENFRYYFFALTLVAKTLSLIFILIAYKTYELPAKSVIADTMKRLSDNDGADDVNDCRDDVEEVAMHDMNDAKLVAKVT